MLWGCASGSHTFHSPTPKRCASGSHTGHSSTQKKHLLGSVLLAGRCKKGTLLCRWQLTLKLHDVQSGLIVLELLGCGFDDITDCLELVVLG